MIRPILFLALILALFVPALSQAPNIRSRPSRGRAFLQAIAPAPAPARSRSRSRRAAPNPEAALNPDADAECAAITSRTLSGRCTSARDPTLGEARRAQFSHLNVDARIPLGAGLRSAREVSNIVSAQSGNTVNSVGLNEMFTFFGQFVDHDMGLSPETEEMFPIPVPKGDPHLPSATLSFRRSTRARVSATSQAERPINILSAALDLSQVYASDAERNAALRVAGSCLLKTSAGDLLPFNTKDFPNSPTSSPTFFFAGDTRASETPVLTSLQTVFVREHNRLCGRVQRRYRRYNAEQAYQLARAINIAQYQKIVYDEWLPSILGSKLKQYSGYKIDVDPTISVEFSTAAFRLGHTLVGNGVSRIDKRGKRLPSLTMSEMFFMIRNFKSEDVDTVLRGASATPAQEVDEKVQDALRNFLFENVPDQEGFDLIALNLQRGRDHAVPTFNELRQHFVGSKVKSFSEISTNAETVRNLEKAYGDVDKVEAWMGLMAEKKRPGVGVGVTLELILRAEFTRTRDGDRFFYLLKNQFPRNMFFRLADVARDLFRGRVLLNRIIRRNTKIGRRQISPRRNAFKVPFRRT